MAVKVTGQADGSGRVRLNSGWNRLLVKCAAREGFWGFKLRLGDARGKPLAGLTFAATPPAGPSTSQPDKSSTSQPE